MLLTDLSDAELLSEIQSVIGSRNRFTARLLEYLGEVEARKLHLKEAYSSMYDFCLRKLGFSEGAALRHIAAARAGRRLPVALSFVADGRVHLTGMALLADYLTEENHVALLTAAAGKTKAAIELLVRTHFPRPDVPESIQAVLGETDGDVGGAVYAGALLTDVAAAGHAAGSVGGSAGGLSRGERGCVAPLAADRFRVEFTMTSVTREKLERVLDLMSHSNPKRSLARAFDRALDVLLCDLEKKRLGKTARPRASRGVKPGNIARSTLRAVYERDGVQCAFVSGSGTRCASRVFLQTDHVIARALGGSGAAHNARVLCQPHNRFEAERTFGEAHVARKIAEGRERARGAHESVGRDHTAGTCAASGNRLRQRRLDGSTARDELDDARGPCVAGREGPDGESAERKLDGAQRARAASSDAGRTRIEPPREGVDGACEVREQLFRALTGMAFRRGETRGALKRLERQHADDLRMPLETLLREALALLTTG